MSKIVAVTGASGHIGRNLVRRLVESGHRVRVLLHEKIEELGNLDVERVRGDVRERASLRPLFEGADQAFHLAALISITGEQNGRVRDVNVSGARNAAEAALECGVRKYVHCSSIHAYAPDPHDEVLDEQRRKVAGPRYPAYDRSKAEGEAEVLRVVERGLDATIVNPTGVLGPEDHDPSRMGRSLIKIYRRQIPACVEGGFNWVDVRDVVDGMLGAAERGRAGENYILAGEWVSIPRLTRLVEEVTGSPVHKTTIPLWMAYLGLPFSALHSRITGADPLYTREALIALQSNRQVSSDKAQRELGFRPRPVRETLRDVFHWFAETGRITPPPRGSLASTSKPDGGQHGRNDQEESRATDDRPRAL